jgi:anti-sigma B factor antagonist
MLDVELSIRDFDGGAVIALRGELDLAGTPSAASHLIAAVAACGPSVIMDLANLEGIGPSGLSVLLRGLKWARRNGGDLRLAAPQEPVRRVLEATGLIAIFAVYPSVELAARGLRPYSGTPLSLLRMPRGSGTCRRRHISADTWTRCRRRYLPVYSRPRRS